MQINDLISKFSSSESYLEALGQKSKAASDSILTVIQMLDKIPNIVEDLEYDKTSYIPDEVTTAAAIALLEEHGFVDPNQTITIQGKTVKLKQLTEKVIDNTADGINLVGTGIYPNGTLEHNLILTNVGINEDISENFTVKLYEVGDELQKQYHSAFAMAAACGALSDKFKHNITDVVANFNDRMADVFSNIHVDLSNTSSYFKDLLRKSNTPNDFLSNIVSATNAREISEVAAGEDIDMMDCAMADYTGTSVLIPLSFNFSNPFSILHTVKKTAAYFAYRALKAIGEGVLWLGSKLVNTVAEHTWNPVDIYPINKKGFGTIDKFQYQSINGNERSSSISSLDETYAEVMYNWIHKHLNQWFRNDTIFAERACIFTSVQEVVQVGGTYIVQYHYKYILKPRIINIAVLRGYFETQGTKTVEQVLNAAQSAGDSLYDTSDLSEDMIIEGLMCSIALECQISSYQSSLLGQGTNYYTGVYSLYRPTWTSPWANTNVTNQDFTCVATGYDANFSQFMGDPNAYVINRLNITDADYLADYGYTDVDGSFEYWIKGLLVCVASQEMNDVNNFFIPYTFDSPSFHQPTYAIKTDSQNQAASMSFLTIAIIIIAAVVATVVIGLKIRQYRREKYLKYTAEIGKLDNKMWQGETLSLSDKKKYLKYQRKLARIDLFSSSLVGSAANIPMPENVSPITSGQSEILKRIG